MVELSHSCESERLNWGVSIALWSIGVWVFSCEGNDEMGLEVVETREGGLIPLLLLENLLYWKVKVEGSSECE